VDVTLVRAAGGLVTREAARGPELVLVHRPAYDDWSFPKGKLERGEDERAAALREVQEETGLTCEPGDDLGAITYVDGRGRAKVVRYWRMAAPVDAELDPRHEIDRARWASVVEAEAALTYPHDRVMLRRFVGDDDRSPTVDVYVVRHVKAGERDGFREPDELRAISKTGRKQAVAIGALLGDVAFTRLVSSPFLRCVQSLEPIADARGLDITIARELSEGEGPAGAEAWVLATAADGPAALCTHGDVIRELVESLVARGVPVTGDAEPGWAKAGTWRLDVRDGRVRALRYLPPPR
jgi:8-oxo-dGTP diphosphatase